MFMWCKQSCLHLYHSGCSLITMIVSYVTSIYNGIFINTISLKKYCLLNRYIFVIILLNVAFLYYFPTLIKVKPPNGNTRYSYYVCTQVFNESEHYLNDWLDYQFNVVGFKNVCLINVGSPLSKSLREKFPFAYVEKKQSNQEFHYCLSSCFIDKPMRSEDMLMIQDIDEYLNVRKADEIFSYYDYYDIFHFDEIRYGYVFDTEDEMLDHSLRTTNLWRKPRNLLGEYEGQDLKDLFKCKVYGHWPSCDEGNGKEMIRVGAIEALAIHFHTGKPLSNRRLTIDMKKIRLNHYIMRTKEDAVQTATKWNKLEARLGQIATNPYFRIIFDDSITESKRLM